MAALHSITMEVSCCCAVSCRSLGSGGRAKQKRRPQRPLEGESALKSNLRGRWLALANEIWVLTDTHLNPTGAGPKCSERANPGSESRGSGGGKKGGCVM